VAVAAASILVIVLRSPALPVAGVGAAAVALHVRRRGRAEIRRAYGVLGAPLLVGLFGLAVGLGTLGRAWDGPARLLGHLDQVATAVVAAVATVLFNNLPAASLLSARQPPHPYALLIGLNLGPNLFVSGSLAWLLWLRVARGAGARPSIARATRIGLVATPISVAGAVAALLLSGAR
jgi:arsenical pump membrane protein